jgi:hypothetical protein
MRVRRWDYDDSYGLAITADEYPYYDGSGLAYRKASIWIPTNEYIERQVHVAITPKRREAVIENGRATLACIGVEIMAGVPVLHLVVESDQGDKR